MILHFMHRAMHHCQGYQKFLDNLQIGKEYKFNPQYFFLSILWLVRHKLYGLYYTLMAISVSLLYFSYYISGADPELFYLTYVKYLIPTHLLFSMITYKIYYLHLDKKFAKVNYDYEKCLKIATPYPWYTNLAIHLFIPFSFIFFCIFLYGLIVN